MPCVYVENHRVVGLDPADPIRVSYGEKIGDEPTGRENPELLKVKLSRGHDNTIVNGISRIGYMTGGKAARWVDEDMADTITGKAVKFIEQHEKEPFFLYFATHDIHVPRVPHARFAGKSPLGPRGDVIQQLDWCVGQIARSARPAQARRQHARHLHQRQRPRARRRLRRRRRGKARRPQAGRPLARRQVQPLRRRHARPVPRPLARADRPAFPTRSSRRSISWPASPQLTGQKLAADAAPDSMNVLPALLGESPQGRDTLVEHAGGLAIRKGNWKYIAGGAAGKKSQSRQQEGAGRAGAL